MLVRVNKLSQTIVATHRTRRRDIKISGCHLQMLLILLLMLETHLSGGFLYIFLVTITALGGLEKVYWPGPLGRPLPSFWGPSPSMDGHFNIFTYFMLGFRKEQRKSLDSRLCRIRAKRPTDFSHINGIRAPAPRHIEITR